MTPLDHLPDGTVLAAYDPNLSALPGRAPGTFWSWRKDGGRWVAIGGLIFDAHAVAAHPNLTIVYQPKEHP